MKRAWLSVNNERVGQNRGNANWRHFSKPRHVRKLAVRSVALVVADAATGESDEKREGEKDAGHLLPSSVLIRRFSCFWSSVHFPIDLDLHENLHHPDNFHLLKTIQIKIAKQFRDLNTPRWRCRLTIYRPLSTPLIAD